MILLAIVKLFFFYLRYAFVDDYSPVKYSTEIDPMKYYQPQPEYYKPEPVELYKPEPVKYNKPKPRRGLRDPYDPR